MKLLLDLQGAQSESRLRGIGRYTRSLAKAIAKREGGHAVCVLLNGMLEENIDELRAEFAQLLPADRILTFQAIGPVAENDPRNGWRMRASELAREAFVAQHAPDVLHVGSIFEGFLDDSVTSLGVLNAPHATAATLYDLIPLLNPQKYLGNESYKSFYLRRAQALKRADLLVTLSNSSRQEALDFLHVEEERIAVIRCGVDERFRPLQLSMAEVEVLHLRFMIPRPFVLYVGALDPRKNLEALLHAFALLPPTIRAAHCLALAGPLAAEERGRVRALGARFGVGANELVFCGHVRDDDLIALYSACALFVFPSRHEGFGLPALEAMACGAAVLAADATSLPEVVGRADLLFDPDKADDLAGKMTRLMKDDGLRASLRDWGVERAAEFSWDECARRALSAFEALHERRTAGETRAVALTRRPRLAFLSPLPNDRTGIADYSAELLPELARHYDIECIVDGTLVTDDWIRSNFTLRDVGWFERNAGGYDRILYSFGNSHFHAGMFALLRRFPGIVLLHDFFLSNLLDWMSHTNGFPADALLRELYLTHGLSGLASYRDDGPIKTIERFACNGAIWRNAIGIIVHSEYVVARAEELFGPGARTGMAVAPFVRAVLHKLDRKAARARLGVGPDDFLVCSFGLATAQKKGGKILDAWAASSLNDRRTASLVFVGAVGDDSESQSLARTIALRQDASRVAITGYATRELYQDHLAAADLAIQLRSGSRGETSAAILDCFAAAVPVIVNAHGPAAELPADVVCKLQDEFDLAELTRCLERFDRDRAAAVALGALGRDHLIERHHPARAGAAFHAAIEDLTRRSPHAQQQLLISTLADLHANVSPEIAEISRLATSISRNSPKAGLRQILCDVTVLAEQDSKTGIQRVVRSVLTTLVASPPPGCRIEAVRIEGHRYLYARQFIEKAFGMAAAVLPDSEVDYAPGDVFLGIDWVPDRLPNVVGWLRDFRAAGGKVVIGVYDLLPLLQPRFFPDFMADVTQRWFEASLSVADQFVCISRTVADDVARFASALGETRRGDLAIDYFHMGGDLSGSMPSQGLSANAAMILSAIERRKSFLMVGTVEPRKGHRQVFEGFDALWREGADVCLVIVGKRGWMIDDVAQMLDRHAEFGKRLFWLPSISDEMLDKVYAAATALIAASAGEGFGLPLIEAAKHGVKLIARDIPVFREVAGDHAFYFSGEEAADVVRAISEWLALDAAGRAPGIETMPRQSWQASVAELLHAILGEKPYRRVAFGDGPAVDRTNWQDRSDAGAIDAEHAKGSA